MNNEVSHSQLVINKPKIQLPLEAKIYAGLFLLILSFVIGTFFLTSHSSIDSSKKSGINKSQGTSSIKRLPLVIDRAVLDSSAYVYVKHTSIRSELGIPWGKKIGLK